MTHRKAGKPWGGGGGGGGGDDSVAGRHVLSLFIFSGLGGGGALAAEHAPAMEMFWNFS